MKKGSDADNLQFLCGFQIHHVNFLAWDLAFCYVSATIKVAFLIINWLTFNKVGSLNCWVS